MAIVDFLQIDHDMLKNAVGNTIHGQEVNFKVVAEAAWATTSDGVRDLPVGLTTPSGSTVVNNTHTRKFNGTFTLYFDWTKEELNEDPERPEEPEEPEVEGGTPTVDDPFSDDWTIESDSSPRFDVNINVYPSWKPEPVLTETPEIVPSKT